VIATRSERVLNVIGSGKELTSVACCNAAESDRPQYGVRARVSRGRHLLARRCRGGGKHSRAGGAQRRRTRRRQAIRRRRARIAYILYYFINIYIYIYINCVWLYGNYNNYYIYIYRRNIIRENVFTWCANNGRRCSERIIIKSEEEETPERARPKRVRLLWPKQWDHPTVVKKKSYTLRLMDVRRKHIT